MASHLGRHRRWGLFVLPSVFIMIALSWIYLAYGDVPLVAGVFYGIKPRWWRSDRCSAPHRLAHLKNAWLWAIAAAASSPFRVSRAHSGDHHRSGIAGYFTPGKFSSAGGHAGAHASSARAD